MRPARKTKNRTPTEYAKAILEAQTGGLIFTQEFKREDIFLPQKKRKQDYLLL